MCRIQHIHKSCNISDINGSEQQEREPSRLRRLPFLLFKVFFPDRFNRHKMTGEKLKGLGALMQEHIKTVCRLTAGLACKCQKSGFTGIINDIRDQQLRVKQGRVSDRRFICLRVHTDGGCIYQQMALLHRCGKLLQIRAVCQTGGA